MSDRSSFKSAARDMRHRLIIDAAVTVFSEFGFRGASMKQVAKLAGVAEGTLYNVFDDKLDLLISILDPLAERFGIGADGEGSSAEAPLSSRLAAFDGKTAAMMRVLLSEALIDEELRGQFGERIIFPMRPKDGEAGQYTALCFVLGAIMMRLLNQDDPQAERAALDLLDASFLARVTP